MLWAGMCRSATQLKLVIVRELPRVESQLFKVTHAIELRSHVIWLRSWVAFRTVAYATDTATYR